MSAALDRLKQQNGPVQSPQPLGSPETMELLTSILAAVEAQNTRSATLTEQQKKLAGFVKVDSEEQEKQLSAISHQLTSTSPPPESNENSELLAGIASTLAGMSMNLNGESLKGSASKSEAAAKHLDESRAKFERAANGAQKAWRESITQASAEATSAISTARDQAVQSIERAAADAGAVATAKIDAANERAEKIIATTAQLEARQLWSVAASMCLALLPVAVIVAGVWMAVAGLITGAQWALDVDGSVWLGIGRWLVISMGLAGAGYGLFASVRWVAGLVETWKGRGMPRWPRWR